MEAVTHNVRLVRRAYWLINLRWVAAIFVAAATFIAHRVLHISLPQLPLYGIAVLLCIYNVAVLLAVRHISTAPSKISRGAILTVLNIQISADLLILTVLLHFSGGIENPFVFYFVFHMIIASILLPVRESYLQATFAVLLFGLLILLEYKGILGHYCLEGFLDNCLHQQGMYILGTFIAFATAVYLMVYMASYVATRLRRAEEAYREANKLLKKKDRIKDEYVMRVTHDIKGDLAAIQTCLDVVVHNLRGAIEKGPAEFVHRAHRRTRKLTEFVRALLRLTQMRLNSTIEMEKFSLPQTIKTAIESVRSRAEEKSISLSCNIDKQVGTITGNEFSIEELTSNLLHNAVKYTPENGKVQVKSRIDGDDVIVEISDTGIGIAEEDQEKIFEEFFRAAGARKYERDGTGLGLSIARHIVEGHKGRIWVESTEGSGTTFSFSLPKDPTAND